MLLSRTLNNDIKFYYHKIQSYIHKAICYYLFFANDIKHKGFTTQGVPITNIGKNGRFQVGAFFSMVNSAKFSTLGKNNRCKFLIYPNAELIIGDKVGISNTTIVATKSVIIGNNVMIGGGVTIVDSDFHSFNSAYWHTSKDEANMIRSDVKIGDNVFIGMSAIILKGVIIGSNVIIAAGSVVTRSIPDGEVWGGNPAKFIQKKN